MPFKRPSSIGSSASPRSVSPPTKRKKSELCSSSSISANTNQRSIDLYLVEAKLQPQTLQDLHSLIESRSKNAKAGGAGSTRGLMLELCSDIRNADVVVTAVQMRKRLERHLDWELAKEKAIVTPQWLFDSVKHDRLMPCGNYAALNELHNETMNCFTDKADSVPGPSNLPASPGPSSVSPVSGGVVADRSKLSHTSRLACSRESPLVCPNQELAVQLDILRRSRDLEGEDISALSYARAVAVIKAYPCLITRGELYTEIRQLPFIGPKKFSLVEEYVTKGYITETQTIINSPRFQSLSVFVSIYGIGAKTARALYSLGLRTAQDLERYYEVENGTESDDNVKTATQHAIDTLGEGGDDGLGSISIQVALALRHELEEKIPRCEVEEMHRVVMAELEHIQSGCMSTIVGGYRRGKPESNDVDIVITHPDRETGAEKLKGLCKRLVRHLYDRDLSGFHAHNALRSSHWDSLQKALTVFILPPDGTRRRIHRRLDLIFADPKVYWTAITGWTGSTMFERDLRVRAKERGLKFDSSGITRRHDSKLFYPRSEREVFDLFGLSWVDPTLRNAGV